MKCNKGLAGARGHAVQQGAILPHSDGGRLRPLPACAPLSTEPNLTLSCRLGEKAVLLIVRPRCIHASPLRARRFAGWRRSNVAHGIRHRRCRGRCKLCAHRMLCVDARLAEGKTAALGAGDLAVPIRTFGRRRARRARSNVSNTLLACLAGRKPSGDICKERLPVAHGSDQRRAAANRAFLFLEKPAADFSTKSGSSGAPNSSATARAGTTAQASPTR